MGKSATIYLSRNNQSKTHLSVEDAAINVPDKTFPVSGKPFTFESAILERPTRVSKRNVTPDISFYTTGKKILGAVCAGNKMEFNYKMYKYNPEETIVFYFEKDSRNLSYEQCMNLILNDRGARVMWLKDFIEKIESR